MLETAVKHCYIDSMTFRFHNISIALIGVFTTVLAFGTGSASSAEPVHWAYKSIERPAVPSIAEKKDWVRSPIDKFILRRLMDNDIQPSRRAMKQTLIRRVTLDLIGIPPTPAQVSAFLNDDQPGAYERVVDRLLASPRYGEKWARPWLDLCHYADTDGYLTDQLRPVAWRYRDWLIDALNQNKPFDEFTIEQIAGDLLPSRSQDQFIATGFLRQTLSNREGGADIEEFRVLQVIERVTMIGTTWLGLTVGCARCHDHKYDDISQQEYFQFYSLLNNADEVNIDAPLGGRAQEFWQSRDDYNQARQQLLAANRLAIDELQKTWEQKILHAYKNPGEDHIWDRQYELLGLIWGGGLGEGQLEGVEIAKLDWAKRTQRQKNDLLDYFLRYGSVVDPEKFSELSLSDLRGQLENLKKEYPIALRAPGMQAAVNKRKTRIHIRGEYLDKGDQVQPAVPSVLPKLAVADELDPRLTLAQWLVSDKNPLTSRVFVNRIWQEFFGRGLVLTSEDFGIQGASPTHPKLLDFLASEFMSSNWDVKALQRRIVLSSTYQQASTYRPELTSLDPENELLARQNSLRLSGETIRDSALATSGLLSAKMGGPGVRPPQPESVTLEAFGSHPWDVSKDEDRYRRAVYTFVLRTTPFAQTAVFDAPSPQSPCARRERSNTPLQALTLLNDEVFFEAAQHLARQIDTEPEDDLDRINKLFTVCLQRLPEREEASLLQQLLAENRTFFKSHPELIDATVGRENAELNTAAWVHTCSVMMNLHEFITRD